MKSSTITKIVALSCLFFAHLSFSQPAGYNFGKQILVNSAQVSGASNLTDFVMLVSFTDNDLRTTSNSGHVENVNGYDIVFTLGDCNTLLDHQIESYNPTTGNYIAWVKIPTLFATANTNIHMYYGNSSVTINPSTTSVWDSNHAAVYHMNQSPAGVAPQLVDYTANSNDGTANGSMVAGDLVAGKIGNAIDFDGSNDYIDCGADPSLDPNLDITVSAWIYSRAASGHIINRGGGWSDPGYSLFHLSNNIRIELQRSGEKDIVDNSISINAWHYVALTYQYSTGTIRCYIDGIEQSNTGNHTGPMGLPVENLNIGRKQKNGFYFNGIIDEGRVIHAFRNSDWITTEYNNQNSPSTFYTMSGEYSASSLCWTLPIELIDFTAIAINASNVIVKWTTASETNNDYFTLQRSYNATDWDDVATIDGSGSSSSKINYTFVDKHVKPTTVYYRLQQTDFDGSVHTHHVVSVDKGLTGKASLLYPNPTHTSITYTSNINEVVNLYDLTGRLLRSFQYEGGVDLLIDLTGLKAGTYILESNSGIHKVIKR
jgi:biopolymer transport protein ExbB